MSFAGLTGRSRCVSRLVFPSVSCGCQIGFGSPESAPITVSVKSSQCIFRTLLSRSIHGGAKGGFVRFHRASQIAVVLLAISFATAAAGGWHHKHEQKARVRFLATSTVIHGTLGPNEDTYLARLLFPRQNEAVLVRLVDAYPNEWPPLAREVLRSESGSVLPVRRDAECDRPFGEILLRTAPGDLMAISSQRLSYRPLLGRTPSPGTVLPCYRVLRR